MIIDDDPVAPGAIGCPDTSVAACFATFVRAELVPHGRHAGRRTMAALCMYAWDIALLPSELRERAIGELWLKMDRPADLPREAEIEFTRRWAQRSRRPPQTSAIQRAACSSKPGCCTRRPCRAPALNVQEFPFQFLEGNPCRAYTLASAVLG